MDDIPAVSTAVFADQFSEGLGGIFAHHELASPHAAIEFQYDRRQHKPQYPKGHHGPTADHADESPSAQAGQNEQRRCRQSPDQRPRKAPSQRPPTRPSPGNHRAYTREQQKQESQRSIDLVEKRRTNGDLHTAHRLGQERKDRTPEYGEGDPDENEIIEEEGRLSGEQRIESIGAFQNRQSPQQESHRDADHERKKDDEKRPESGLRERMNRGDHAAAREKGPENRQAEGQNDQHHVPDLQHVFLFLDHHRVEIRGAREPRHERRVLHGIPGPVAAPSQDQIGPLCTEKVP